jgi:hypothetical protein
LARDPWKPRKPPNPFKAPKQPKPEKPKNLWGAAGNREKALQAGRARVCLSLRYDGLPRMVEIQVVGTTLKDRPAMRVYQVDGQSNSTPTVDWRLFCFDECFDVSVTQRQAAPPRSDKNNRDKGFKRIDWAY